MITLPENYAKNQRRFTSNSRGTKAGNRVLNNVLECSKYLKPPIVCIGCGDGLEIENMTSALKIEPSFENLFGVEVAQDRVLTAQKRKLPVVEGVAENLCELIKQQYGEEKKFNIYCAHTLEHTFDVDLVIANIKKVALDTVVIIVPIELRGTSGNLSHHHPIANLGIIANMFGMNWKVINMAYRWNLELEGIIVLKKDIMCWPEGHRKMTGELIVKTPGDLNLTF